VPAAPAAVSAADAAAAVRAMLTAAGLPADPAADALLERSLALQAELRAAQERLCRLEQVRDRVALQCGQRIWNARSYAQFVRYPSTLGAVCRAAVTHSLVYRGAHSGERCN